MAEPVIYLDRSEILQGKLEEVKAAASELVDFVRTKEPQILSYNFFFDEDGSRMTVVAIHPDSASMEFHMKVAGPAFRKFADLIKLSAIEIYGQVSEKALQQLQQKARMLGGASVTLYKLGAGFARFAAR